MAPVSVFCNVSAGSKHDFYLLINGREYYLFTQAFRRGVSNYFKSGISLKDALDFTKAKGDWALLHTMEKLPLYIKYVESDNGLEVLKMTVRKNSRRSKLAA